MLQLQNSMYIRVIFELLKDQNCLQSYSQDLHPFLNFENNAKGVTNIDALKSNFEMDQLEQRWPDMYCQHQNPDGVLNIGYTRIG